MIDAEPRASCTKVLNIAQRFFKLHNILALDELQHSCDDAPLRAHVEHSPLVGDLDQCARGRSDGTLHVLWAVRIRQGGGRA